MLVAGVMLGLTLVHPAEARRKPRTTNTLSNVTSYIILNYKNSGQDICHVYNGNNRPAIVTAKVWPGNWFGPPVWGTAGPAYIGVFQDDLRFYGWISGPYSTRESCLITSVQLQ